MKRALMIGLVLGATPILPACDTPLGVERQNDFDRGLARWQAANLGSYRFDFQFICGECPPVSRRPVRLDVVNGTVVSGTFQDDGSIVPEDRIEVLRTIDGLFDLIAQILAEPPHRFSATYDDALGFPRSMSVDLRLEVADDEFGFGVDSVMPLFTTQPSR